MKKTRKKKISLIPSPVINFLFGRRPAHRAGRRPKPPSSFRGFLIANGITSADENRRFRG
jgi:hypothetical protein